MKTIITVLVACMSLLSKAVETITIESVVETYPAVNVNVFPDTSTPSKMKHSLGKGELNRKIYASMTNAWQKFSFNVPASWINDRIFLKFPTLNTDVIVFVNGKRAGEINGCWGEVDLTGKVNSGSNTALVYASKTYEGMSRTAEEDILRYQAYTVKPRTLEKRKFGIGRGAVELERCPREGALRAAWTETSVREKKITLRMETLSDREINAKMIFTAALRGKSESFSFVRDVKIPKGAGEISCTEKWENPVLWDLYLPNMYNASVTLLADGKVLDSRLFSFGFREIWVDGRKIILNGHPVHFHVEMSWYELNKKSLGFFRRLGLNTYYIQPHPSKFWGDWMEHPVYEFESDVCQLCDEEGIALFVPTISGGRFSFVYDNEEFQKRFLKETLQHMKRYRNHPSILGWTFSMNNFNPKDAIHPDTLAQRSHYSLGQGRALETIAKIVKKADTTRLSCPHADGNLGDVSGGNTYPNWTPVQEIRDYPETWLKKGDMPYFASEYDAIYYGSYHKDVHEVLFTEYGAIYFGEKAYETENITNLMKMVEYGVKSTHHTASRPLYDADGGQMTYDLRKLYVDATDKYWRSAGIQMWQYFHGANYGKPGGIENRRMSYGKLSEKDLANWDTWTNRNFAIHEKWRQPLLCYIAGAGELSDQTRTYYPREIVEKQIASVWDGPGENQVKAVWEVYDGTKRLHFKRVEFTLSSGCSTNISFSFKAPETSVRKEYTIKLSGRDSDKKQFSDSFVFAVLPKIGVMKTEKRIVLLDTEKKSQWVKKTCKGVVDFESTAKLDPVRDILVIGRESLKLNMKVPWTVDQIASGLKVIILEQQPQIFETFGLRTEEVATRLVYPTCSGSALMKGLEAADLSYWRGRTDLLPEYTRARAPGYTAYPKGSNKHVVSSFVIETPQEIGFTPFLQAECDLAYAPILKWAWGKGMIFMSTMDFTGRVGKDPGATTLAANFFECVDKEENPVLGETKLHFNLNAEELAAKGIASKEGALHRVKYTGELAKILPANLGRWRDVIRPVLITEKGAESNGLFFRKGDDVYVQLSDTLLKDRYADDSDKDNAKKRIAIRRSIVGLRQAVNRVKTAFGTSSPKYVAEGFSSLDKRPGFYELRSWYVFGPFYNAKVEDIDTVYPGEKEAVAGDLNPNYMFDGKDFRKQVTARVDGYIDLDAAFGKTDPATLGYAICEFESPCARDAVIRLGYDWFLKLYVNGEKVDSGKPAFGAPASPNKRVVPIKLKKGTNIITIKLRAGHAGFGFWANVSEPGADISSLKSESSSKKESLYDREINITSPYIYNYW